MKSFFTISLIGAVVSANKTLEEVYGHVEPTLTLIPWSRRQVTRSFTSLDETYRKMRTPENCVFPLEIVILQDATASFEDDFVAMRDVQLGLMTDALKSTHPDSKFSVVSFRDKPVWSLGDASDYCQRFEAPLSSELNDLKAVYDKLVSTGGADPAENQFGAIVAAAQSATPGWSTDETATRLMVISTDAYPHFADDGLNTYGMSTFSGTFDEANAESQCLREYYPSPKQIKQALTRRQAYLAQLIFDGDWNNGLVRKSWEWTNDYLGQTAAFLEPLANDASNFWTVLSQVIKAIEDAECAPETSTTPSPTTASPSTTPAAPPSTTPTTAPATSLTSASVDVPVSQAGTTQASSSSATPSPCPPCPPDHPECTSCPPLPTCPQCPQCENEADCKPEMCVCNNEQVFIRLAYRPKSLNLTIDNEDHQ